MKGTEKIIAHIAADAKARADAILARSDEQCASIRREYEAKARTAYEDRLRAGKEECSATLESAVRLAQMEERKSVLSVKQEMIRAGFNKACEMLVELPREQYVALLAKLAKNAAVTGEEEIVLNARDKDAVGEAVVKAANELLGSGKLTLAEETGDFAGGLILRRENIEVNCTAELLVKVCRDEMSAKMADVLFA